MEEAKQEHVDKVGELLKWVSEKSKSLAKRQLEPPAEQAGVETSLSEKEVLHVELSSKKDQIDEAVHVTHMFLAKHSDKISEEDKQQTERQLESLQEAYDRLCEETSDDLQQAQSMLAEEAVEKGYETVAGAIDLATGTIYPIFHAIRNGLIDYDTGMILLEAQVIVSGLILPETKQCLGMEEALRYQLIDGKIFNQLEELSNSAKLILSTLCGISDVHSAADANDHSTVSEISVIKVLEAQFATGGLRVPATGEKLSLEEAFQREFITAQLYFKLLERQKMCKELIDPITAEKVSLMELMQRVTVGKETGLRLLRVKQQEGGTITLKSGRQASVFRAVHEGLIDREVMIRLLGAQLFAGGLIDPQTGSRLTVDEALESGLIDHDTASGLLTHQVQTGGIISPATGSRLTMDEAVQCNLITSSSALLVLESQRVFMGLIWPDSGEIFSIDTSLQQGVVTNELAHRILNNRQKIAALYIPESSSVLTPEEASKLGVIDKRAAKILSTATMPDLMPGAKHLQSSHADISSWGSNSEVQMCVTSDTTDVETRCRNENSTLQQMEVQQKFISYLMMHSYMDAGSGRRLLLVNSDLNEKIKMVLEASGADVPSENWQEYLHIQDGSGLENHLEAKELSKDADILKNHTNFVTWGPHDTGEKQAVNALGEHCGTINSEALYWMPGVQQFPASEAGEFSYSQTMDSPGNHVTDTKELDEGKAIHAIETLDNLTDILEEPPFDGNLSAYPDLNESIKLTRQTGNVNSVESDSGNQLRKSAAIPKPDTQAVTTALETADLYLGDKLAITMSSAEQPAPETMHRFPMEQLFPASESLKLSPFPLDMDLQRDFGEDLNRMLGFDGPPGLQCGDNIGSSTEDSNDPFVICAEHANKTAQNWNAQQYMEASQVEESDDVGGRQSIAVPSVDKIADNAVQSSPLGQQLMTRMDEFISHALEPVAATREDLTCGENNIRTVETLEDIAFVDEMVNFVGAPDAERLSEEVKIDEAMKVEGDEQSFKDGKHIPAADEDTQEDTNLENQVSFPKFTETNLDSQIIQGSVEEMWDVIGPSVEEHLTVTNEILHLSPLETGSESEHCTDDSGGHEDGKYKVIRVIETLDDIADLEDKLEISGEPVTKSSSSKNDKPCSNEDYNEVAFGNGLSGFTGIVEGDSIHQYTDTTSALGDNFEYGMNKVITSVEGLEDIAENQEMPWFVGDIPGVRETLMLSPSGIEDITGVFEPSIQMAGGEVNFLGDEDFKPSNNESDQSHQMYHQDFGIMKGQEEKGKQVNIELMHEAIQSYGAFEQDASGGNLTMSDTMMINRCLDVRCTLQEEPSDCAVTLKNVEGIQRINGRNLYVLEEEDEENDGKITCFEAAGSGEWARSALIKQRKSEVEVGGIFDPVTGKRYRLEVALARGLLDEEMFVDILASQFQDGGILFEGSGENLTLSEAVAKGLLQSHVAIKVLDKLGLIGGFYNSGTGEIIEVADVAEQMINDDLLTKVLLSEKIVCGIIDPETNKLHSVHDAQRLGILNTCTALRLLEGQVVSGGIVDLKHQGRLSVAVTSKLCLVDEKTAEQLIKIEKAQNGGQVDEVTKLRALSYQLEMYGILDPQTKQPLSVTEAVNRGLVERGALLSILGKQVEAGGIIQHKSGLRLSVTNALRHSLINEDLADDLFELEAACQNIHASSAGKNLCSQEIAPSSKFPVEIEKNQKSNELVTEFENGKSAVQIESVGGKLLDDSLHKEINLYESEDNVDERQLTIVSYSDLARISKIDIDTGRRYMAVKPLQEVLNVKNVETMSKLNVVDVDLSNACSTRRKELNDQTLICAKEDKSTVQDFVTRSDDNHQINSSTSNFFIPGRNQDSFVTTAQSASATHIPEEDLPGKLDRLSAKSSYVEDSPQGDFFSYIRECTSDIELECEASKLAGKENVLSNEDGELNEVGKLTVETFIGGANIEELESNNCPSSTNVQGLMGTNGECNLEGDVEGGDPNVKLGLLDKAPLTGIFKERNQRIQNSGLGDCAEGFEQNVNMAMSVGNVLKAVCMKFSNAFKIRPKEDKENPNEDTVMNGNRQEKEAVKTLNDLVDLEGKAEFAYRVKEMSIVSGARGNEGETSDHGDQNSFGESEDLLCQEGIDEEMQDQNVEGGQKLEKPLGKTWDSFELEKKANLVSKEERLLPLENVLGFAIDEHESLENANFQRVIGVNVETGDNQEADHFSLMECNTEGGGGSAVPAVQDVVTCGDPPADVKKSGLVLDCLKREFLNEEFSELFGLKDDESLKMAALLAALKPEMMSAQVQEMLCALSEEQDTGSLRSQELVSSLTDEIFRYIKNKVPGSMEDGFLNRQVKEMLCERILLLLSTAETPQDVSQQTIEEGNMYQIIQMKANGNPVNHCGSSHGELESREGTDKVARCDSPSKDDWFNNDESGDTMNGMPKIKQDSPDSVMQSADVFDEMEPLEDTRDKGALEDPPDNIWIGNNEGVGELKEMLQVRLAGQCVSENENEEAQSDSLDQIDLLSNIQGNTYELTLNEFRVKDNKGDNEKGKTEILNGQNITEDKSERLVLRPPPSDKEEFPKGNVTNNVGDANKVNEREMQTNGQCTNQGTSEDSFAMDDIQEQSIFEDTPNSMWINNNKNEMKKVIEIVASGLNLNEDKNDDLLMQSHDASDEMKPLESTGEKATIKTEQHEDRETLEGDGQPCNSTQQCLQHMEKLQAHLTLVQKKKIQLENLQPVDSDLEILQEQLDYHNLLMCELEEAVTRDLRAAEKFLEDIHLDHDEPLLKNLETDCKDLQTSLGDVTDVCASGVKTLSSIIEMEQFKVKSTHREFLAALDRLSGRIQENAIILETFLCDNPGDLEALKSRVQQHKDLEKAFTDLKIQLDATTFEVQFFVSEHALDLSPQENRKLLKLLNSTQTSFKSAMEKLAAQLEVLNLQLQTRLEQDDQKAFEEKQGDCNKRLQEMCDLLLVTESKIIDYDSGMSTTGDGLADLQQHQVEHQALQREIQANATTLANVVSTTEEFLEKNGDKLQPEERSAMDKKLKDAKAKLSVLSDQVDSNLKNIDNAVTTALKQETEKAAAVEQLKENENKIQGLLGWLSSIGPETVQQNGNTIFVDGLKRVENEDTVNGNLPRELSETKGNETMESTTDGDLNYQYQKAKLHHQQVMSQQQSYIISTQSVQDFLKKQGSSISAEEREKLEQDLNELKVQYETVLAQSESRLKLVHTVQDELQKFSTDYSEFENWLHESEQQLGDLQSGATDVEIFVGKLQRQKSFSEDVISHKGDLRYITISGQRVLDAAKLCGKLDLGKDAKPCINTSATCALVQRQLEVASDCYKLLHSKCNTLGKNLKDVVDKYSQYQEISASLLPWLQVTEEAAKSQLAEAIAADPQNLQKQLEQVQALQDQMSGHQSVVENLRKTVDALISTDGDLLLNRDEIQDHLDDVVLRYESLSKSTNDRNEKLRMTLTRSLSVQDGLDEMLDWMEGVEKSLEDEKDMPLNSVAIQEAFSKNAALEQNIASRQSSISAIKEKANKFIATADMSRASALQAKVEELAKRFTSASGRQKERTTKLEKLRDKVERFEKTYQKIEQFVTKKSLSLPEIDGPGKDVTELSQHMQEINTELLDQSKDLNTLNQLAEELGGCATAKERTQVLNKVNTLSKNFQELEEAIKKKEEKLSCYQHQSDQFKALLMVFKKWVEGMNSRIPIIEPSLTTETLQGHLSKVQVILNEWSSNASLVEEVNQNGSALCHLINTLISPAHSRTIFKSELITIKQDIADVNHQYEELGDLLKNKGSQLESMLAQRQQVQEEAHLVKEWLESMDKRTASWDTLPTETEAIKGQVEQHKAFETELNQKTGKVGQVKEKLTLLLEENTDAPEAGKWRQMLDYIDSKWQQVSQSAAERQQKLEESSSFLIQFETAEIQLSQWLVEKELMMNVLGPLSIDPHMLNNQKQQVQILLKEFESRKPQHEQLKTAADGILSRSDDPTPACGVVSDQLAAVMHKWDNLTGKLVDRSDLIDQAIVKSTRYQNLVRDLSGRLSALDIKLASQPSIGSQPEAVKSQLETASEIRSEVEQEEKSMQEAQTLCEEISSLVGEQYLKAELSRQLDNVLKPFQDLEERAGNRVHQLQSALANSEQFQQMFDDFQAWMGGQRREQDQRAPVSAKLECLQLLINEQAEFQKSLAQKAGSYEMILVEGEALLQNMQPGAEKTTLQGRLGTLRADWEELARQVEARQEKMRDCFQKAQKYRECVEHLLPWIQECEAKASRVQVCSDAAEIESSLASIRGLQTDVDKHRRVLESLNNAADSLIEVSQTDLDDIQNEKASVNQRVDLINEQLCLKISSLDEMAKCMKEFQNSLKDAKKQLDGAKQQLELHDALGPQAYSNKCLTNMNAQQKTLQALTLQVENVGRLAQRLAAGTSDGAGTSLILRQASTLQENYGSVSQQVRERCCFLETKLQGIGRFQNNIREMFSLFADLDDELDSMAPVGRHLSCLHVQKDGIREFIVRLQELTASIEGAKIEGRQLLESASSPDLLGLKRDLDALSKQCNKLLDRAMVRQEQVETNLARVEEFDSRCKTFSKLVAIAEQHEESQDSVGTETDIINQQLESFKVFQKEEIEPLQTLLQEVNRLGQGLIQSAAKNTNIQKLEHDLEEANTRWNTLTTKVAERAAKLQEALLHCGRFQDAFESLLSWLMDTEELVANQKPPSAEFKVVKAQIQEQKLLQHLLDDRKPTVEMIKREGEKIAGLADSMDREKTLNQLQGLSRRWNSLLAKAENRQRQLEAILVVAQQFHDTVEPLIEWLSAAEKKVANSEPIGTQTTRLQEQISQHKAMEDDVVSHGKQLHQAISVGQLLKNMSSRDDKDTLQGRLDSAQTRYIEIQDRCGRKAALIQQALSNAWIFGEEEVEVLNWLAEVQDRLNNAAIQDYDPEHLEKQHSEHLALHEDIMKRKQHVDQAIKNGLALLKQTTGDEVIIIQERLDGIKARYAEITTTSAKVLKTLEQALQLATKFQSAHEVLATWLEKVEAELTSYASEVLAGEQLAQAQERQKELRNETMEHRVSLDTVNEVSSALLELVPWRAREGLDKLVSDDNERYRLVSDTIAQKVEEIDAAIQRSQQFEQAADAEIAWITETEKKLKSLGDIRLEQDQTSAELQVQKAFSMDILRHKDTIDELVANGDQIMNSCTEEEKTSLQNKLDTLQKQYEVISQMNAERYLQLERAQSLVSQFCETYEELWPWLEETRVLITQLPTPAIEFEMLKQQQEELRQLRELIAEHKPHIDKMNKTGPQLLELSPREGLAIQQKYTAADALYSQVKEDVKRRATSLDEAISQSTQFHDKISPMLDALERIARRLRQPPSISAEVEKIREQISENKNVTMELEKLQPAFETLKQRGDDLIGRSEGTDKDFCAKAVQDQLDKMVFYWADIKARAEEQEAKLLDVMDLAEKFWCDHSALIVTIKDTQDLIRELEEPGIDPSVVKEQQEALETIKEEVDGLQEELEIVQNLGAELTSACGEPDKPVVKKNIDELNCTWDNLNKAWKDRIDRLDEAMQEAVQFQDALQAMFDWMDIAENKLNTMPPIGTDLETVKQQIAELKQFKTEAYQQQIEMERLNHQGGLLLKKVNEDDAKRVAQEPLHELKHLWVNLDGKIVNRQHKLEGALLALGQFQHALDELMTWLNHTEELLNEQKAVGGDPKAIEIAIAKHHVLQNDVLAHKSTVETVNKAGNDLLESSDGEEASSLQSKLESLNQRWKNVLEQTEQRQQQLNHYLIQAQGFQSEIENMQRWLVETERQLLASKPVGGLPETAREQLRVHLELCAAFKSKEETYKNLINRGHLNFEGADNSNVEQGINNLKERWESVEVKLNERKVKLEEALNLATEFHNSLQDFINWLTQAEQTLTLASSPSLILDTIMFQIDEHKVFANEVNSHREKIIELDKTGTHLKYFSQKQDVVLIKNLLISVQARWEKVVQRSVDRGRGLDDSRKRAKQFQEAWKKLMEWLEDSEKNLDSDLEIANDPDKVKMQLVNHKEFQKALGAKHSVYDTTVRTGRSLKEKTTLADDHQKLDDMLSELRDKWDTVCGKSVERQNKLEEALLFSGQFTDALQALIDWLYKIEPMLAEDQPVHGDIDLVMNLIDAHKVFQKELGKRTSGVQALKRSARELVEASRDDSSWVKVQMQELSTRWETVCALSVSKQARLEQALNQAEEFHSAVHVLLEWLAEAEQTLRFHGVLPDDDEALRGLIEQHKEFVRKLEEKMIELNLAVGMGEAILSICHPDSITTIKHWITIIRARFEEVTAWAKQHQLRLEAALADVIANQELLENLLGWLHGAETILTQRDQEPLPQEIEEVKTLIAEHQTFVEEMTRKQPDVDKVTKTYKRKAAEPTQITSQIPVIDKGRSRKRFPARALYSPATQTFESKNPHANLLVSKWQQVWLLALDRRRKLNDALDRLEELREFANFDFDVWRKRYMRWMNHKKSRVMDFFRRIDKDQDGKITRQEFIDGILSSKFPTSRLEMSAVADIFDRDGDGYIDYYEFVAALHPNKDAYKPLTDADKIEDEVTRQVAKCKCAKRFQVEQIGENKYRFGDSQQLRLVRILRSTVMVRVGGGWMALDEFLVKNDPCRVHHHGSKMLRSDSNSSITSQSPIAKGRTNVELREKFMLPETPGQSIAAFRSRGRRSRPSSRAASPNRSTSSASQSVSVPPATTSTPPKTPQHLIRNYDKPWLTNSKTSSPYKSPESPERRIPSPEVTPIQGSKLRPPGYLSGKSFHSGDDSNLSTPPSRGRSQVPVLESRKVPSRPTSRAGSKTGSRTSSRRGSDASDFDISDIQSVCSDVSETVPDTSRSGSRAGSRPSSAKPSKIPTPSRRSPAASKLSTASKR